MTDDLANILWSCERMLRNRGDVWSADNLAHTLEARGYRCRDYRKQFKRTEEMPPVTDEEVLG